MHRQIVYPASIPQETDILSTNRHAMVGLGLLALDIFGSNTIASGFGCTATGPASLNVVVAPGRIYSSQNVDNSAYSSLAADTAHQILKQGSLPDAVTLGCPAPATSGFSINYLIQVAYQDQDTDLIALPYYNSANPSVPWSGPANSGATQATTRKGVAVVTVKAGTAATTGSQTTPAADTGNTPLYVVTVANGQSTITSSNISVHTAAPFVAGSFTVALTGCTTSPTATVKWCRTGANLITALIPALTATSNSTTCGLSGLPSILVPASSQSASMPFLINSGSASFGSGIQFSTDGSVGFFMNANSTGFTASGTKGNSLPTAVSWLLGV